MKKVKVFTKVKLIQFEDAINLFLKDVELIDIKFSSTESEYDALVIYKDKRWCFK